MTIQTAQAALRLAHANLVMAVHATFPLNSECVYRRSPKVPPARVRVIDFGVGTLLHVINDDTGSKYFISGESHRIARMYDFGKADTRAGAVAIGL